MCWHIFSIGGGFTFSAWSRHSVRSLQRGLAMIRFAKKPETAEPSESPRKVAAEVAPSARKTEKASGRAKARASSDKIEDDEKLI